MKIQTTSTTNNSRGIVKLYFKRYKQLQPHIRFPKTSREWAAYCSRVKGLKEKEQITWDEYAVFVNKIFDILIPRGFNPSFGMICSQKVFRKVKYLTDGFVVPATSVTLHDFQELQAFLYNEKYKL